jgi:hypothetical protein
LGCNPAQRRFCRGSDQTAPRRFGDSLEAFSPPLRIGSPHRIFATVSFSVNTGYDERYPQAQGHDAQVFHNR